MPAPNPSSPRRDAKSRDKRGQEGPGLIDFLFGLVQVCREAVNQSGLCKDQQMLCVP